MSFILDPWLIAVIVICVIVFLGITIIWGIKAHRLQVTAGREDLIGRIAEVMTPLEPKGFIFVEGENWTATSEDGRVEAGEEVVISKVDGLKLRVHKKVKGG
ncbi:NfeD family protein [Chloroflexota bacterium]